MKKRTRLFLLLPPGFWSSAWARACWLPTSASRTSRIIGGKGPTELAYVPADARWSAFANVRAVMDSEAPPEAAPDRSPDADRPTAFQDANRHQHRNTTSTRVVGGRLDLRRIMTAAARCSLAAGSTQVRIEGLIREQGGLGRGIQGQAPDHPRRARLWLASSSRPGRARHPRCRPPRHRHQAVGSGNVTGNAEIMQLVKDVDDGNAWAVARFDALTGANLPAEIGEPAAAINWFSANGRINGGIGRHPRRDPRRRGRPGSARRHSRLHGAGPHAGRPSSRVRRPDELPRARRKGTTVSLGFAVPRR